MDGVSLKLLIVDDETNLRNLIKLMVDWEKIGVRVVGEASTGAEALDLMEEELPDIVLTDIEMPYMDGIELCERVFERYHDITVIILTAHDHFAYAQQALRLGVSAYILKPLDKEKLEEAIGKAALGINDRRFLLRGMETSYKYVQSNGNFFRDHLLGELIHNGPTEGMDDVLEMVDVRFTPDSRYTLALMKIADKSGMSFASEKYLLLNNCKAYVEETYAMEGRIYAFIDGFEHLVLLSHDAGTDLPGICRRVTEVLGEALGSRICCGISDPCEDLSLLRYAYAQASDALRLSFIAGEDVVYTSLGGRPLPHDGASDTEGQERDLLLFIKGGLTGQAVSAAEALLERTAFAGDLNNAKMLIFQVLSKAMSALTSQNVSWLSIVPQIIPSYTELLGKDTFPELEDLFSEQIRALCEIAKSSQRQISNETVSKIMQDIEENYGDQEISLANMARKYSINSSYLSRVFKSCTEKSFSEYLIETRIKAAKNILEHSDMKAYQIAQMVGIPDPNYFTKCFKKVTGKSFQAFKASKAK